MSENIEGKELFRELTLERKAINTDNRTVPASLSSDVEIERFFGREKLVHSADSVNLERAGRVAAVVRAQPRRADRYRRGCARRRGPLAWYAEI